MKRVLFDSDVLLDVLAQRQPFVVTSALALNTVMQAGVEGYVSGPAANIADLEIIVTRNTSDFAVSSVSAMLPEEFLAMLSE